MKKWIAVVLFLIIGGGVALWLRDSKKRATILTDQMKDLDGRKDVAQAEFERAREAAYDAGKEMEVAVTAMEAIKKRVMADKIPIVPDLLDQWDQRVKRQ